MNKDRIKDGKFQVDLKGLIRLLSENLYSGENVFLRELLQNAIDAITARSKQDLAFKEPLITVRHFLSQGDLTLEFCDNGIGLTEEDLHIFLSVIGLSSKRSEGAQNSFIGQFGIGLLSCFLVTNEICVDSRAFGAEETFRWVGRSDGTYEVLAGVAMPEAGTVVRIKLTGNMAGKYSADVVKEHLSLFGFLVDTPIHFTSGEEKTTINDHLILWRHSLSTFGQVMDFGEQVFGQRFFDVIPLDEDGLQGYIYLSSERTGAATPHRHKIYLKNMFITEDGKGLVPKWAFFTRCIINGEKLTPTASRESFQQNGALLKACGQIEQRILNYFMELSLFDLPKLKVITGIHNTAIKSLVVENDKIYQIFFPFLMFSTNNGNLTGAQLLDAARKVPVYYCMTMEEYRRVAALVSADSCLLVNASYVYDESILKRLPKFYQKVPVKRFEPDQMEYLLQEVPQEAVEASVYLIQQAELALAEFHCLVSLKQFASAAMPALYVPGEDMIFDGMVTNSEGDGFPSFLDDFSDYELIHSAKLYLNYNSKLVKKLMQVHDPQALYMIAQILYVQALLAGQYPLGKREIDILNENLTMLIELGIS